MLIPDGGRENPPAAAVSPIGWRIGAIEIDLLRATVRCDGRELRIERSGYEVLRCLVERAGTTVSKEDLLAAGWPGRVVSENSLAKAIGKLRLALGDSEAGLVQAVHGYGYRLAVAPEPMMVQPVTLPGMAVAVAAAPELRRPRSAMLIWSIAAVSVGALVAWAVSSERTSADTRSSAAASIAVPVATENAYGDVIAILPFQDHSPDQSLGLLSEGFANHLREQMQRMPAMRTINRAPSLALRDDPRPPAALAEELGANLIVTGSLSSVDGRLHVEMELNDTRGRIPAWSRSFERAPYDQATLLDDLTASLYENLGDHPDRWRYDPTRNRGTANPEAYRTFLRAATLFAGNNDPNSQRRTLAVLRQAIELDPDYADALLMHAGILGGSGYYADSIEELVEGRARAIAGMDHGIAMVPENPDNYLLRSEMRLLYRFDWDGARADLDAAAARTPGGESVTLLVWKARLLASEGRLDEAIAVGARAIALDPQSGARRNQGWHYLGKGDTRNARAVLQLQLQDLPENPHTNFYLALCDILEGQPQRALDRLELSSTLFRLVGTAVAQHELGDRAASDLALQKLADQFAIADGYWVGAVHAWRGENDEAFAWIERALRGGDSSVMYVPFDPLLAKVRDDPRYAQALRTLNLPAK
jgi:TolB-like protein